MDSILNSIKKLLGIPVDQEHFDTDVIMYINSAFSKLWELGVGPKEAFRITDDLDVWETFTQESSIYENVKEYVYLYTKLIFDPPLSSSVLTAYDNRLKELEWRLSTKAETNQHGETDNE